MKKIFIYLFIIQLATFQLMAQNNQLGSWNILNSNYHLNDTWSIWAEGQIRSLGFYSNFHYYEYKGGFSSQVHKNIKLTLGAGSYQTYNEGGNFLLPKNNDEFRLWPQFVIIQSINNLKIEHRYRAEFRFTNNGYRERFRYRLGLSYPFGKVSNGYKPYQISTSNEIFFTDNEPYFERNRFQVAFNYKPTKATTIQIGYLHQFDYKINDETGRDFLQIGYFIELFRKTEQIKSIDTGIKDN